MHSFLENSSIIKTFVWVQCGGVQCGGGGAVMCKVLQIVIMLQQKKFGALSIAS